jgi:antitoxin PrlF
MELCITSVSSKGQVVIPGNIRAKLGLAAGARLVVMTDGEHVLMKPVAPPRMEEFATLVKESQKAAKAAGLTKADLQAAIVEVRRAHRH